MTSLHKLVSTGLTLLCIAAVGCNSGSTTSDPQSPTAHTSHAHPSKGPHDGELIELGHDEYHAELLHDHDAAEVTIYILNDKAATQVPIDAAQITINVTHDGNAEQFALLASPDDNEPTGKSSRFVSKDKELFGHIEEHDAESHLVVTINNKSYRGILAHNHKNSGHTHH